MFGGPTLLAVSPFVTIRSAPTMTPSMSLCCIKDPSIVSPIHQYGAPAHHVETYVGSQIMVAGSWRVVNSNEVNRDPW